MIKIISRRFPSFDKQDLFFFVRLYKKYFSSKSTGDGTRGNNCYELNRFSQESLLDVVLYTLFIPLQN